MPHIAGVFDNTADADAALSKLLDEGFQKNDISLIVSDTARHAIFSSPTVDESTRAMQGGTTGAVFGGVLGALIAGLTAVGVVVVPGSGLLVAGPLVTTLAGGAAGAAVGGVGGALISAGFAANDATRYEKEIKDGKAVIVIHTTDEMGVAARGALLCCDPQPETVLTAS